MFLVKFDVNGDTIWTRHIGEDHLNERGYSIVETYEGGYLVCGDVYEQGKGSAIYIIKIDGQGNSINTQGIGLNFLKPREYVIRNPMTIKDFKNFIYKINDDVIIYNIHGGIVNQKELTNGLYYIENINKSILILK